VPLYTNFGSRLLSYLSCHCTFAVVRTENPRSITLTPTHLGMRTQDTSSSALLFYSLSEAPFKVPVPRQCGQEYLTGVDEFAFPAVHVLLRKGQLILEAPARCPVALAKARRL